MKKLLAIGLLLGLVSCGKKEWRFKVEVDSPGTQVLQVMMKETSTSSDVEIYKGPITEFEWTGPKEPMIKVRVFNINQFGGKEYPNYAKITLKRNKDVLKVENDPELLWY